MRRGLPANFAHSCECERGGGIEDMKLGCRLWKSVVCFFRK